MCSSGRSLCFPFRLYWDPVSFCILLLGLQMLRHRLCQDLADFPDLIPLGFFSRLLVSSDVSSFNVHTVGLNFGPGGNLDERVELATVLDSAALENTGLDSEVVVIADVTRLDVRAYFKRVIVADSHRLLD